MKEPQTNGVSAGDAVKPTLFVVDDEPMLLDLATVILQTAGYQVRTFRDGEIALQAFKASPVKPAVIITDYAMHSMSGLDLVRECKRLEPLQKVLLVSGTVDEGIYSHSPVKPDRFLAKPYHARQLVEVVRALISG
jgi:DNA-binding response OmpR family regulator